MTQASGLTYSFDNWGRNTGIYQYTPESHVIGSTWNQYVPINSTTHTAMVKILLLLS